MEFILYNGQFYFRNLKVESRACVGQGHNAQRMQRTDTRNPMHAETQAVPHVKDR
jgi:hypothetical protein